MGVVIMENLSTSKDGVSEPDLEMGGGYDNLELSGVETIENYKMKQSYNNNGESKYENMVATSIGNELEDVKSMVVEVEVSEKKVVKERPKAMSAKKPPKPPRPPRGLSLDSADQKLIRELHQLAKLKRARVERMKALKKAKEAKLASSKNQLFATLLTVLFCLVVLLQGNFYCLVLWYMFESFLVDVYSTFHFITSSSIRLVSLLGETKGSD